MEMEMLFNSAESNFIKKVIFCFLASLQNINNQHQEKVQLSFRLTGAYTFNTVSRKNDQSSFAATEMHQSV